MMADEVCMWIGRVFCFGVGVIFGCCVIFLMAIIGANVAVHMECKRIDRAFSVMKGNANFYHNNMTAIDAFIDAARSGKVAPIFDPKVWEDDEE